MLPIDADLMMAAARNISPNIALYVPRTCDVAELTSFANPKTSLDPISSSARQGEEEREGSESGEAQNSSFRAQIEIEQNMLNGKTKTVTAYFGELVMGEDGGDGEGEGWEDWGGEEEEVEEEGGNGATEEQNGAYDSEADDSEED